MFYTFDEFYGPSFYCLGEPLSKRDLRYIRHFDHYSRGGFTPRYKNMQRQLRDRSRFVQTHRSHWKVDPSDNRMRSTDLSVEVLENRLCFSRDGLEPWRQYAPDEPSLSLNILDTLINAPRYDFNQYHEEERHAEYHRLLRAYFTVTAECDTIARNEPNASDDAKRLIAQNIVRYANPTRTLLLDMAHTQVSGTGAYYMTNEHTERIDELLDSWVHILPRQSQHVKVLTKRAEEDFMISQADTRVQMRLNQQP